MNTWGAIKKLVDVVETGTGHSERDMKEVVYLLDFLTLKMHGDFQRSDCRGKEIPEHDYQAMRTVVEERFPNLGFYNIPADVTKNICTTDFMVGDAIDDLTDIVNDLKKALWAYENDGEEKGMWTLKLSYDAHWCSHMRDLQWYLHHLYFYES